MTHILGTHTIFLYYPHLVKWSIINDVNIRVQVKSIVIYPQDFITILIWFLMFRCLFHIVEFIFMMHIQYRAIRELGCRAWNSVHAHTYKCFLLCLTQLEAPLNKHLWCLENSFILFMLSDFVSDPRILKFMLHH